MTAFADDPFAPLPDGSDMQTIRLPDQGKTFVMPAPIEPPAASAIRHNGQGTAVQSWIYRDAGGQPLLAVARFERQAADGQRSKVVLPMAYVAEGRRWDFGVPQSSRPLYGLDRLHEDSSFPVLLVEGEKAADAAQALFLDHVAIASQGGAEAAAKTDWSPLRGRDVLIWPDQDAAGRKYAAAARNLIKAAGASSVTIIEVPSDWPEGWDVADPPPPGVTAEKLIEMACSAVRSGMEKTEEWVFTCPTSLVGRDVPARLWIVQDWLAAATVTIDFGDGGVGKTLLAQQLMTSACTNKPWCGLAVEQCRSIALFCEDDEGELHRRQDAINRAYSVDFDDLASMEWISGVGHDNTLATFDADGFLKRTPAFQKFSQRAKEIDAKLIVIDTAADTFGGNEIVRRQVRQFVGACLGKLAKETGAAVLLNAHPSRAGLSKDGDQDGGSTGWSNTARARWSLSRPKPDGDEQADANARILTRRKSNYASIGDTIKLRWERGVLVPASASTGLAAMAGQADADTVFLALLTRLTAEGRPVSVSCRAGNFAPKEFAACPDRCGHTRKDFEGAMQRLFVAGKIANVEYGRAGPSGRPRKILPADQVTT